MRRRRQCVRCEGCCSAEINKIVIVAFSWSFILFTHNQNVSAYFNNYPKYEIAGKFVRYECLSFIQTYLNTYTYFLQSFSFYCRTFLFMYNKFKVGARCRSNVT